MREGGGRARRVEAPTLVGRVKGGECMDARLVFQTPAGSGPGGTWRRSSPRAPASRATRSRPTCGTVRRTLGTGPPALPGQAAPAFAPDDFSAGDGVVRRAREEWVACPLLPTGSAWYGDAAAVLRRVDRGAAPARSGEPHCTFPETKGLRIHLLGQPAEGRRHAAARPPRCLGSVASEASRKIPVARIRASGKTEGATPNARDNDGNTPLHDADRWGRPEVVRLLRDRQRRERC